MKIAGLQKLTLLDFPGHTAATVFTAGCNYRCPFCHNADLVEGSCSTLITEDEFFSFLDLRRRLLEGVCITGGEPLMQSGLEIFCTKIKERGFAIKLDTNGSFPDRLQALVEANLVDYVAMDIKNCLKRYELTSGVAELNTEPIERSVSFLLEGKVPFEFRTTVVREFHDEQSLLELARWIKGAKAWHLQEFVDADSVLAGRNMFHEYPPEELRDVVPALQTFVDRLEIRGN